MSKLNYYADFWPFYKTLGSQRIREEWAKWVEGGINDTFFSRNTLSPKIRCPHCGSEDLRIGVEGAFPCSYIKCLQCARCADQFGLSIPNYVSPEAAYLNWIADRLPNVDAVMGWGRFRGATIQERREAIRKQQK